jgi:hypothetical protein
MFTIPIYNSSLEKESDLSVKILNKHANSNVQMFN